MRPKLMISNINLEISRPGAEGTLRAKLLIPAAHTLIFIEDSGVRQEATPQPWALLLTEIQHKMMLDPDKLIWLKKTEDVSGGYILERILADYYENSFYDVRIVPLKLEVEKAFREAIDHPMDGHLATKHFSFSRFPKQRFLTLQVSQLLLALAIAGLVGLTLVTAILPARIRQQDTTFWQARMDAQTKADADSIADTASQLDDERKSLNQEKLNNQTLQGQLREVQTSLAAAKAAVAVATLNAQGQTEAESSSPVQVRPALPPDTTVGNKDVNLENQGR